MKNTILKNEIIASVKGICSMVIIFFLGFFVMYSFWTNYDYPQDLPGLFYYRSATIGDAICLPALTGVLVLYISLEKKISNKEKRNSIFVGLLCGIFGAAMQMEWLINDKTKLNWTIPEPHYFNLPGWYHAFFFVLMFFVLGTLFAKLFYVKRKKYINADSLLKINMQSLIWLFSSLFLFLVATDDVSEKEYFYVLLKVMGMLLLVIYGYNVIVYKKILIPSLEFGAMLSGVFSAFAIANVIIGGTKTNTICIVLTILLMIILVMPNSDKINRMINYYLLILVPLVSLEFAVTSYNSYFVRAIISFFSIIVPLLISYGQKEINKNLIKKIIVLSFFILVGMLFLVLAYVDKVDWKNTAIFEAIPNIILSFSIPMYIKETFKELVIKYENEENAATSQEIQTIISKNRRMMYIFYFLLFLAILIFVSNMFFYEIPLHVSFFEFDKEMVLLNFCLFGIITLFLFFISIGKIKAKNIMAIFLLMLDYICLFMICYSFKLSKYFVGEFSDLFVIPMCLGAPIVIGLGFYNNLAKLNDLENKVHFKIVALVMYLGILIILPHCYCYLVLYHGFFCLVTITILVLVITILLPFLIGKILMNNYSGQHNIIYNQVSGVVQDGLLYGIAIVLDLVCSCYYIKKNVNELRDYLLGDFTEVNNVLILAIVASLFAFGLLLNWPLKLCITNNINHYNDRKKEAERENDIVRKQVLNKRLMELKKHLTFQNIMSLLITFPYSIITIAMLIVDFMLSDNKNDNESNNKKIINMFIPYDDKE